MKNKEIIVCPESGEFVNVKRLTSPFTFSKEELENLVTKGKDPTGCFSEWLDEVNRQGAENYDALSRKAI